MPLQYFVIFPLRLISYTGVITVIDYFTLKKLCALSAEFKYGIVFHNTTTDIFIHYTSPLQAELQTETDDNSCYELKHTNTHAQILPEQYSLYYVLPSTFLHPENKKKYPLEEKLTSQMKYVCHQIYWSHIDPEDIKLLV